MKIRNGFVSNSSSSSFIVATDKNQPLKLVLDIESECNVISTEEELREYYVENYDMNDKDADEDAYMVKEYKKCLSLIKKGKVIKMFTASNDDYDSMLSGLYGRSIKSDMFDGNVTIINEGEC